MARCKFTAPWPERTESRYLRDVSGMLQAPGRNHAGLCRLPLSSMAMDMNGLKVEPGGGRGLVWCG